MLDTLTHASFAGLVGEKFDISFGEDKQVKAELIEATESKHEIPKEVAKEFKIKRTKGFSLIFLCPDDVPIEQGTYNVEHKKIGEMEILLVPVGPDSQGRGVLFQAVFN